MELTVISPKGVICRTDAQSVQLPGAAGRFAVLRDHAPLVSVLVTGDIIYRADETEHTISIKGGFVRVSNNKVEISVETDGNIQ